MRSLRHISWLAFLVFSGNAAELLGAAAAPPMSSMSSSAMRYSSGGSSYGTSMSPVGEYLYGQAAIIQSSAMLMQAQATAAQTLVQAQEASVRVQEACERLRAAKLETDLKYATTFYEKRKMYEQYHRAKHDGVPLISLADFPGKARLMREAGKAAAPGAAAGDGRPGQGGPPEAARPEGRHDRSPGQGGPPEAARPEGGHDRSPGQGGPPEAARPEGRHDRSPGQGAPPGAARPEGRPARLASCPIRPISRRVVWPQLLCRECFDQQRAEIDRLASERTVDNSGVGSRNCEEIQQAVEQMKALLKAQIKSVRPEEYLNAKKFLENVASEARLIVDPTVGAVAVSY